MIKARNELRAPIEHDLHARFNVDSHITATEGDSPIDRGARDHQPRGNKTAKYAHYALSGRRMLREANSFRDRKGCKDTAERSGTSRRMSVFETHVTMLGQGVIPNLETPNGIQGGVGKQTVAVHGFNSLKRDQAKMPTAYLFGKMMSDAGGVDVARREYATRRIYSTVTPAESQRVRQRRCQVSQWWKTRPHR
jgi:hypothetical protein